jgi:acyl-CoA thioester hydrolase
VTTSKARVLVHTSVQAIRWGDQDALGHVNNTVYFRFMEQARIEWLFAHVAPRTAYVDTGPVIVNASCTFLRPLVYPGDVEVRMFVCDVGRSSVGTFYELLVAGDKYAEGAAKMVWIDIQSGRSVPLPEAVAGLVRPDPHPR